MSLPNSWLIAFQELEGAAAGYCRSRDVKSKYMSTQQNRAEGGMTRGTMTIVGRSLVPGRDQRRIGVGRFGTAP
jgi:hypothetical protein